jgi:hypothetical protein
MRLELLAYYLEDKKNEVSDKKIKFKLYDLLYKWITEVIYIRFIIIKKIADRYPKLAYKLLNKNEFHPMLDTSFILASKYEEKYKSLGNWFVRYSKDLVELRNKIHRVDMGCNKL